MSSTNKAGDPYTYTGMEFLQIDLPSKKVKKGWSYSDGLDALFGSGERLCFQKGNNTAACGMPGGDGS